MFGDHFYNQRTRMSVAVFGAMFNDLYIVRRSGNKVLGQMKVPLSYAPKRKFLERISEMNAAGNRDIENQLAIKLPRMSFEITNMAYDPQRQLPKTNYYRKPHADNDKKSGKFHVSTPYIITFELNVYGKQHDDCLQVVEQIIPYFNPQYTVNVKPMEDYPEIVEDVPVILSSVTFTDNFEGALEDRRTIVYTLSFEMKITYFGPKPPESSVIENIEVDFFNDWPSEFSPPQDPEYLETLRVEARQDSYPYHPINPDSDYTINVDVINLTHPYSGDPSYRSDEVPNVFVRSNEEIDFNIGELYNHHRNPYSVYTTLDPNISIFPAVGDINMDVEGNITGTVTQVPGVNELEYSIVNTRNQTINTTIRIISIPDSDQDNLIQLEGDDGYGFIITEPSDGQNILDLYELEDSA